MKKRLTIVVALMLVLGLMSFLTPQAEAETERQKLLNKMEQLKAEENQKSAAMKKADAKRNEVIRNIKEVNRELNELDRQLAETEQWIADKEAEIAVTEDDADAAAQALDAAIARVEARDELLKVRVRALYETGEVSYLEALLDSTSIGDFLSRIDMMEKVVHSDKTILAEHIADKLEIEARKAEIEAFLAKLRDDYTELNEMKASLEFKYKEKTVFIASLEHLEEELEKEMEKYSEELAQIAKDKSATNLALKKLEYSGGLFTWPVPDSLRITSNFGYRTDPITGQKKVSHTGVDIGAPLGTTIVAGAEGEVILAKEYGTYGNTVMIDHGGIVTLYAHIRHGGIKVKVGDKVERGQKIAEVGSTGRSTGPHLHFSVLKDGVYKEPMDYLKAK